MTFEQYFNIFTGNSGWEIGVNEIPTDVRTLTFDSEETSYDRMNSVATQFGVEAYFSFSIVGTTMVKCYLNVVKKRGADRGITLRVGDEINRITVDSDSTNLMTAVYARGATPDGSETPINLVGYSYTDPTGQFVLTKEGYLLDTVSNRIYSRLRQNSTATVDGSYLNHVIDYEATTQASLLQSALADLKQNNHPAVNYTIELAKIPQNIRCGDTVQIEQEDRQLYLAARVLELDKCYSNPSSSTMVMGDYLLETSQVAKQYQDLAQKLKDIPKTIQYYPWVRYADDNQGTNMSALPAGKKYMAVVYSNKSSVPSDNPADYAGKWALIKGADGADGVPGAKGADGRTSYFHTAWADSIDGKTGFTVSGGDGKKYIGTYSDFTLADSTNPADYNWALLKELMVQLVRKDRKAHRDNKGQKATKAYPVQRVLMVALLMPTLLTQTAKTAILTSQPLILTASTLDSIATSHLATVRIQVTITGHSLKVQMVQMVKMGCQVKRVPMAKHRTSILPTPIAVMVTLTFRWILPALASTSVVIPTLRKQTVLILAIMHGN